MQAETSYIGYVRQKAVVVPKTAFAPPGNKLKSTKKKNLSSF